MINLKNFIIILGNKCKWLFHHLHAGKKKNTFSKGMPWLWDIPVTQGIEYTFLLKKHYHKTCYMATKEGKIGVFQTMPLIWHSE